MQIDRMTNEDAPYLAELDIRRANSEKKDGEDALAQDTSGTY